ncbi:hypothetical protein E4U30_000173, partial [Claviceps sp. LM220 group G6]
SSETQMSTSSRLDSTCAPRNVISRSKSTSTLPSSTCGDNELWTWASCTVRAALSCAPRTRLVRSLSRMCCERELVLLQGLPRRPMSASRRLVSRQSIP